MPFGQRKFNYEEIENTKRENIMFVIGCITGFICTVIAEIVIVCCVIVTLNY